MAVYAIIGTGNMGGALARGLCKKVDPRQVILFNRTPEKARRLAEQLGCRVAESAQEAVRGADYVLLGVKPYLMQGVIAGIAEALPAAAVLVSMAPGFTMEQVRAMAGGDRPVIRIMPNTPVAVGEGLILYDCSGEVTQAQEQDFLRAMAHAGRSSRLEEHLLDAGSAVSGCGPAFAALFLEALADGGVACGLPRHKALAYAAQMLRGTAQLLLETGEHPGALKDAVCSPGGTTIQGVRTLEEAGFRGAVMDAVIAAYEKTKAL